MKLLITGDWHADAKTLGHARFEDVEKAVEEMIERAVDEKVGAFLFLGDLCDPDAGSAAFRSVGLAIHAAMELQEHDIKSHWLAGNHDVIEDGSGETTLSPLRSLVDDYVRLYEKPEKYVSDPADGPVVTLHMLPFAATSHNYSPAEALKGVRWGDGIHIVAGHLAVEGVQPGEETFDMPRGRDVIFPRELFKAEMTNVHLLNGHYHRQQTHGLPGFRPLHIPGAPARFTFGEQEHEPGYFLLEV